MKALDHSRFVCFMCQMHSSTSTVEPEYKTCFSGCRLNPMDEHPSDIYLCSLLYLKKFRPSKIIFSLEQFIYLINTNK